MHQCKASSMQSNQVADVHLIRTTLIPPAPENAIVVQHIDSNGVDRHYSQELSGETFNHVGANGYLPINYTCNQTPDLWSIFSIFQSKKMKMTHVDFFVRCRFFETSTKNLIILLRYVIVLLCSSDIEKKDFYSIHNVQYRFEIKG